MERAMRGVGVGDGVRVGVGVRVAVAVGVAVGMGVNVGVKVGISVKAFVGIGDWLGTIVVGVVGEVAQAIVQVSNKTKAVNLNMGSSDLI